MDGQEFDVQALGRDWVTLWHSELAAMAADPEAQETWRTCLALWAAASANMLTSLPKAPSDGGVAGGGRSAHAPRAAAAAAASDPRDAEIERLSSVVAELERRLARLESAA